MFNGVKMNKYSCSHTPVSQSNRLASSQLVPAAVRMHFFTFSTLAFFLSSVTFSAVCQSYKEQMTSGQRIVYSRVMASANIWRAWKNRKVQKKNKTAALTSAWKGSGSSMLGPMTALLSSLSFLSRRPAAMTAACCSATLAASSSWKSPWERSRLWGSSKHKALHVFSPSMQEECIQKLLRSLHISVSLYCSLMLWFFFSINQHSLQINVNMMFQSFLLHKWAKIAS